MSILSPLINWTANHPGTHIMAPVVSFRNDCTSSAKFRIA